MGKGLTCLKGRKGPKGKGECLVFNGALVVFRDFLKSPLIIRLLFVNSDFLSTFVL